MTWNNYPENPPKVAGKYLVYVPGASNEKSFVHLAWFVETELPQVPKWQLITDVWASGITHWSELPESPKD